MIRGEAQTYTRARRDPPMPPILAADGGALVPILLVLGVVVIAVGLATKRRRPVRRSIEQSHRGTSDAGRRPTIPEPDSGMPARPVAVADRPATVPPTPIRATSSPTSDEGTEPSLEIPVTIRIETSVGRAPDKPDSGEVTRASDDSWVLNPRSPLPLTLTHADEATAAEVKALLESAFARGTHEVEEGLVAILARSNARCREIDEYVTKHKPHYLKAVESRIAGSSEWASASELDREDLLAQFRQEALDSLDVRPFTGVEELFDSEPSDFTLDDRLLERFGYEPLRLYFQYRERARKVMRIAAEHYHRKGFEWLVQIGLARRGSDVPTEALLDGVTLKEMREMMSDVATPSFARKAKAIEFFAALPDARERLGKVVSFREVFQLLPMPPEFVDLDLDRVAETWRYTRAVADLVAHTYLMGAYSARNAASLSGNDDIVGGWEILDAGETSCPSCRRAAAKKYPTGRQPQVPLHIGCRCSVTPVTKSWEDLIADAGRENT